jgi:circadian clock protein KaiC
MHTLSTGIKGLDTILHGGLPAGSSTIVEGAPGTGKTTFGLQFLHHGATVDGESGIYITFEELPEQIYRDTEVFGWDLKELERQNRLRVLCISPDTLFSQMLQPSGVFESMVREIGCRRLVIDSISLYRYGQSAGEGELRKTLYTLRGVLRRLELTSILLKETTGGSESSFENYVFDGVIRLVLQPHLEKFRLRKLEVLKMRGRPICEGEHVYRINGEGIHVLPAGSMVHDASVLKNHKLIPTGLSKLDELLSGGIPTGSVKMLDTNSKANYKYIMGSIVSEQIRAGNRVMVMLSSFNTVYDMKSFLALNDVDLDSLAARKALYFIEHYRRPVPPGLENCVLDASGKTNEEYREWLTAVVGPVLQDGLEKKENWFIYYDLNTIIAERGKEFVLNYFTEETAWARSVGVTVVALCNFREVGEETASYLERTSNGVIRTWVDGAYQFVQVTKSSSGRISEPLIVENIKEKPFIRLM